MKDIPAMRIKPSPYRANYIAVAHAQNFGIAGKGYCKVNDKILNFDSVCTEIEWSEDSERLYAFTGKGNVLIYNANLEKVGTDHMNGEVVCCRWNFIKKDMYSVLLNDSWYVCNSNGTKEKYSLQAGNELAWSPRNPFQLSIVHLGGLSIYDIRQPTPIFNAKIDKCMSLDHNKYNAEILLSTVSKQVLIFDERVQKIRLSHSCHDLTIKGVKCSPFDKDKFATCSYDLHTRYWKYENSVELVWDKHQHSEIITGLEFSLFERRLYDCSWDGTVLSYEAN
eukprot:NODE_632_length_5195_cov_0.634812.p3 type:complete len:280 gc:universal NODE_632_length_5195_cov_0.634812:4528-3689(-)